MSTFGRLLRVTTFGESHGIGVGCIIEGIPPNLEIHAHDIQYQLNRRKPNQNSLLSPRTEPDIIEIYSGIQQNVSLGTPICLVVKNIDIKPCDYKSFSKIPRPGHADLTYLAKYGVKSSSGGGRASARETVARVAAGALVENFLRKTYNCEIVSWVFSIGQLQMPKILENKISIFNNPNTHKSRSLDKSFIDCIGTFKIYKNSKKSSDCKVIDLTESSNEEKWIIINKLVKKAFLYLTERNEIINLDYEFLNDKYYQTLVEEEINSLEYKEYIISLEKILLLAEKIDESHTLNLSDLLNELDEARIKDVIIELARIKKNRIKLLNNFFYEDEEFEFYENINIRCPHIDTAIKMIHLIHNVKKDKDSIGGIISCVIKNIPRSLGEPCFDKFEAELARAMLSIPATKAFEFGSGFEGTKLRGSEHNDVFIPAFLENKDNNSNMDNKNDKSLNDVLSIAKINLQTRTNNAGGTLGGITTGENVYFKVAIKPVSTIGKNQETYDFDIQNKILEAKGRHDPCVLPRAIPIVESMAALVTGDHCLIQASRKLTVDILNNNNFKHNHESDLEYEGI